MTIEINAWSDERDVRKNYAAFILEDLVPVAHAKGITFGYTMRNFYFSKDQRALTIRIDDIDLVLEASNKNGLESWQVTLSMLTPNIIRDATLRNAVAWVSQS